MYIFKRGNGRLSAQAVWTHFKAKKRCFLSIFQAVGAVSVARAAINFDVCQREEKEKAMPFDATLFQSAQAFCGLSP